MRVIDRVRWRSRVTIGLGYLDRAGMCIKCVLHGRTA